MRNKSFIMTKKENKEFNNIRGGNTFLLASANMDGLFRDTPSFLFTLIIIKNAKQTIRKKQPNNVA